MHRTEGVDYTTEEGKRRYIDPNLPSVRGTLLNAESMNALQEEICNVIEKAGLTLNATAAADRADGWDQLWEAITNSGIIGEAAFTPAFTDILNVLRYGINAHGTINPSEVGPCYTRIAIIPKVVNATRLVSGRITHLGGDFPWNSRGLDFMLEQRDSGIVAFSQGLQVFTSPGVSDGNLFYKDINDTIEIWAFCTASYPRIVGTMYPSGNAYWNKNASAEWTTTDPTGLIAFTNIEAESTLYVPKPTSGTITVTSSTHESQFTATPANGDTIIFPNTHVCWAQLSTSPAIGTVAYLYPKPTDLIHGSPYAANVSFLDIDGEPVQASLRGATGDYLISSMTVIRKGSGWQVLSGGIYSNIMSTL